MNEEAVTPPEPAPPNAIQAGSAPLAAAAPRTVSLRRRITSHPLTHLLAVLVILGLTQAFFVKIGRVPSASMQQTLEVGDRVLVNRLAYSFGEDLAPQNRDIIVFKTDELLWPQPAQPTSNAAIEQLKHGVKFVFGDLLGIGPATEPLMMKRVIGTSGQTVECCSAAGKLKVDSVELDEPYIFEDLPFSVGSADCSSTPVSSRCFAPVTVPKGMLLVLGDHRSNSSDGISLCRGKEVGEPSTENCARWVRVDDVIGKPFVRFWPLNRIGGIG